MIPPAVPPTMAPMIAPLAVEPFARPTAPPAAAPTAAPVTTPVSSLLRNVEQAVAAVRINAAAAREDDASVMDDSFLVLGSYTMPHGQCRDWRARRIEEPTQLARCPLRDPLRAWRPGQTGHCHA